MFVFLLFSKIISSYINLKTLNILDLESNLITEQGAKYLADLIEINQVIFGF